MDTKNIKENLIKIKNNIKSVCKKADRNPNEIKLEIVTKGISIDVISELINMGLSIFGENRIKQTEENRKYFISTNEIHMIGHLDSNDAGRAVAYYHLVESLDSVRLAHKLNYQAQKIYRVLPVFLQIKTDNQMTKHGFGEDEIYTVTEEIVKLPYLKVLGLMTLPPLTDNAETSRPYFKKLKLIKNGLEQRFKLSNLCLSMGTSQDYSVAIEEGSDIIRLGRAIFGFSYPVLVK